VAGKVPTPAVSRRDERGSGGALHVWGGVKIAPHHEEVNGKASAV
jgi:hypothetical protein